MSILKKLFSNTSKSSENKRDLLEGDIFYCKIDGKYFVYKLLVHETNNNCYHVLTYTPLNKTPSITEIDSLKVFNYHAPIDQNGFENPIFMTNKPIKSSDLIGYHEYLKQTQSPEFYIPIANNYYKTAYELTNDKKHLEAIDEYSKAIDLFPQFFEAIDNRAFCKMDLGLFKEAIVDFELSLQQNPNSMLAEFSIGECYLKMNDFEKAKIKFEIVHKIDPNNETVNLFLDKVNHLLKNGS